MKHVASDQIEINSICENGKCGIAVSVNEYDFDVIWPLTAANRLEVPYRFFRQNGLWTAFLAICNDGLTYPDNGNVKLHDFRPLIRCRLLEVLQEIDEYCRFWEDTTTYMNMVDAEDDMLSASDYGMMLERLYEKYCQVVRPGRFREDGYAVGAAV